MTVKMYPGYRDSSVAWIGDIPSEWATVPLWTLFTRVKRTGFENEELLSVYRDHGVVIKSSRSDNNNNASEDLSTYQLVEPGDLAINKMKAWQGSAAVSDHRGIVSPAYFIFRSRHNEHGRFLHYLMRSLPYVAAYGRVSKGIRPNQWDLDPQQHSRLTVLIPPRLEQVQIADYLDVHTAKIDALIGKQERLIETLAERQQAVISHAVTKGLDPNAPMKDSGVEWLGEIPSSWRVPRVAHHFSITLGKMVNAGKADGPGMREAPYLRAGNVQPYGVDVTEAKTMPMTSAELVQLALRIGDLVVVEGGQGGYGRSALVLEDLSGWGFQNHVMRVRPESGESNAFLDYVLKTLRAAGYIASLSSHASLPSFSAEKLAAIRYGRPPLSEQAAIVEYLDRETSQIDALSAKAREMIDVLKERRQALISAAVTGKIDVRGLS